MLHRLLDDRSELDEHGRGVAAADIATDQTGKDLLDCDEMTAEFCAACETSPWL